MWKGIALSLCICTSVHAECVNRHGGTVDDAIRDCATAPLHCLRGTYHSAATLTLINGSPVSPTARFCFHKSSWQSEPGSNPRPDPEGNAMLMRGYDRVPGLSAELRRGRLLDHERETCLTGAHLISMKIARACQ